MCSAAALPKFIIVQSDVRQFSIGSKWLYADSDLRLDASTYAQEAYEALRLLERCPYEKVALGSVVRRVYHPTENQARSNFKRIWTKEGEGIPFLTGKQLFFLRPDKEKFVSRKMQKIDELRLPKCTILLTRSGTTGFPVLVNKYLSQFAITDDVLRIFPGTMPIGYVYAYLASSIGRPLVTKGEYGSTVDHLEAKHVTTVPIPLIPEDTQKSIHKKILRAYALRDRANQLFNKAEQELYELLAISAFTKDDIEFLDKSIDLNAFSISSSDLIDRLDATNYIPVVRSAINKLQKGAFGLVPLSTICSKIFMPPRFKRNYVEVENGVPYLLPSQLCLMRPFDIKALSKSQADNSLEYLLEEGNLLITTDGTVGRVHLITERMAAWFGSNNMVRLWDENTDMGFLYAYLATPYGLHQLRKDIYGGVVDHINESHIATVLCPNVPMDEQSKIGDIVRSAFRKKDEANDLEDDGIAELESIISG